MIKFKDNKMMLLCLKTGWEKLKKYYQLSDITPVYIAALVLHPQLKFDYIDKQWPKQWARNAQRKLETFWTKEYKLTAIELTPLQTLQQSAETLNKFEAWFREDQKCSQDIDELEQYLAMPIMP